MTQVDLRVQALAEHFVGMLPRGLRKRQAMALQTAGNSAAEYRFLAGRLPGSCHESHVATGDGGFFRGDCGSSPASLRPDSPTMGGSPRSRQLRAFPREKAVTTRSFGFRTVVPPQFGVVLFWLIALTPATACAGTREVARADLGAEWPLTVGAGTLACRPFMSNLHILTFTANGKVWAVNGTALGQGYADIEPIWAPNPNIPEAKINIGPMIDLAKSLCEK